MHATKLKAFLQLVAVLTIVGFHSIAQAVVVNLEVNAGESKLLVTSPGACAQNNSNGCIRAQGRIQINFNLVGEAACPATGGSWRLSKVALGNSENSQGGISAVAASDFNANTSSGVVTPVSISDRHIGMRNNNTAAYDIWYTVYASCGSSTITSDPRVVNDGSGNQ